MCLWKDIVQYAPQKNEVQGVELATLIQSWPEGHLLQYMPTVYSPLCSAKKPCDYKQVSSISPERPRMVSLSDI